MPDIPLFLLASAILTLAPGPDNLQVLARGMAQGRAAALAATCGFASGVAFHTALAISGVALLIRSSPGVFGTLRYAGAAYLAWLGLHALLVPARGFTRGPAAAEPLAAIYRRSVLGNVLNPKVSLFFLAFLPQFLKPEAGGMEMQMALLGLLFMVQTLVIFGAIGGFAAALGHWLRRHAAAGPWLDRAAGAVFVAVALRLAMGA